MSQHPGGRGDERPLRAGQGLWPLLQVFPGQRGGALLLQPGHMSAKASQETSSLSQGEPEKEKLQKNL